MHVHTGRQEEQERLAFFASAEGAAECYDYCQRERRTFTETLEEFGSVEVPPIPITIPIPDKPGCSREK